MRQPQSVFRGQDSRVHSNTLAATASVTKATDGADPATRRKKRGYGKRADEEQPSTMQRHCQRACPTSRGAASDDRATQTARNIEAVTPDVRAIAYGKARLRRRTPVQKARNRTGAQNRLARAAKQPRSPRPCSKHVARRPTAARNPRFWSNRKFVFRWQEHPGQLPSPPRSLQ